MFSMCLELMKTEQWTQNSLDPCFLPTRQKFWTQHLPNNPQRVHWALLSLLAVKVLLFSTVILMHKLRTCIISVLSKHSKPWPWNYSTKILWFNPFQHILPETPKEDSITFKSLTCDMVSKAANRSRIIKIQYLPLYWVVKYKFH